MELFGYQIDDSRIDEHPDLDELAQPYFHKGNNIGCICIHGIGGTPANMRVVSDALEKAGYTVDVPMLAGHGTTIRNLAASSWQDWVKTVEDSYDKLKAEGCDKIAVLGLSLGGILSAYLAEERDVIGCCCLSAPFRMKPWLNFSKIVSPIMPYVSYPPSKHTDPHSQGYRGFCSKKLVDLQKLINKTNKGLGKITCPVHAIWARKDDKVDESSKNILRKGLKNAKLTEQTLENSPHGSTYGPEKLLAGEYALNFIQSIS